MDIQVQLKSVFSVPDLKTQTLIKQKSYTT